jgi:REP element-mobilizing transposase RayT
MTDPLAHHVILCTHGFWLPNDPRGSWSTEVREPHLRRFGPATTTTERRSLAVIPHDLAARKAAKKVLKHAEVIFDGHQALSVARGFATMTAKGGYVIHACPILPCHVHLVIVRHSYSIAQVVRLLRQAATMQLLRDGRHPFAAQRQANGYLPSVWAQDFWKTFLNTEADLCRAIRYVEENPIKEGKRAQHWSFVTPFAR